MDYEYFMQKALSQARNALSAGEFPVGCVVVREDRILTTGARKGTAGNIPNEIDHAEIIALKRLADLEINRDNKKIVLFTTLEPCLMCLGALILSGISEIVYAYEDVMGGGLSCDLKNLMPLYKNSRISVVPNILRKESLELFQAFFNNSENSYWQGSLLADYTLRQP
ncbi:MAG: nucleoside deaminase [Deltaproteobacteria bacterium]|jgi:tRNA(adenine34) deaminase|nr:nucleoside deaminase [Deltaproteobacteria bacterium]MBW2239940.1 nucleoside deaminase [Deltaproteobacteria bacterium]MBW2570916.1 nucleoside deaminase [Deltaproteobacteria bacterium]MBW2671433.1 nucleoside deaminase [Deltaproteobacteria bacterium]MBW2711817.1 nucleoside deaminase [Deltaproteobacteria bacterium]